MNMSKRDVYYYVGFFIAAILASVIVRAIAPDLNRIVSLVVFVCAGIGGGLLAEKLLNKS